MAEGASAFRARALGAALVRLPVVRRFAAARLFTAPAVRRLREADRFAAPPPDVFLVRVRAVVRLLGFDLA
jgi:hypothetical protein